MTLRVLEPVREALRADVARLSVPARDGVVGILPHHIDYVTAVAPGILTYIDGDEREAFVGIDEGILVKRGQEVLISTRQAVTGYDLGQVQAAYERQLAAQQEQERRARSALERLEVEFVRHVVRIEGADADDG